MSDCLKSGVHPDLQTPSLAVSGVYHLHLSLYEMKNTLLWLRSCHWLFHWRTFDYGYSIPKISRCFHAMFRVVIHLHSENAVLSCFCSTWQLIFELLSVHQLACSISSHAVDAHPIKDWLSMMNYSIADSHSPYHSDARWMTLFSPVRPIWVWRLGAMVLCCCKPAVFAFMKMSLDWIFLHWYRYLLQDFDIMHLCVLRSSGTFRWKIFQCFLSFQ